MSIPTQRLIAAPHTPFSPTCELNIEVIEQQAAACIHSGAQGAFIAGTTGEYASLTVEERLELARRWVDVAAGTDLSVIIHVGHNSMPEAIALAEQAEKIGADGIAALTPSYYKPKNLEEVIECCAPLASAAPSLPFYYYHIPGRTDAWISPADLLEHGSQKIPTLAGLKFSHSDMAELQRCLAAEDGRYKIFFGSDEMLLAALALGAQSAVGATYNYAAPLYLQIIHAFQQGDWVTARTAQLQSVAMVQLLNRYDFLPASKAVMNLVGVDCGPVRAPLRNLNSEAQAQLYREIKAMDVLADPIPTAAAVSGELIS